ncbi:MAG: AbrB/MazE/SpoVT family DNA-binding domain-containing protein [Thermodesulfobacteriota bacterium]
MNEVANPMTVKITEKRQVTFPARVLDAMGVKPGDRLEIEPGPNGFILRPRRVNQDMLAPLRGKLKRGQGTFDLNKFREEHYEPSLRD